MSRDAAQASMRRSVDGALARDERRCENMALPGVKARAVDAVERPEPHAAPVTARRSAGQKRTPPRRPVDAKDQQSLIEKVATWPGRTPKPRST